MAFDLVVRNGMIVDGSGLPRYRGDIGVIDGRIAEIGRLSGAAARETLDAALAANPDNAEALAARMKLDA